MPSQHKKVKLARLPNPVRSINELYQLATMSPLHSRWLRTAATNLGGGTFADDDKAKDYLVMNAMETDEEGVVGEINGVRDCL